MTRFFAAIAVVCCALMCVGQQAAFAVSVSDVVNQVSLSNYTDIMQTQLYTHLGDSRSVKGGAQHDLAAQNIFLSFRRDGLTTRFDPFTYTSGGTTYNCKNVVAVKQGTTNPDHIYIVGSHYDSNNSAGADDDASGVAGVMEAARVLSQYDLASTIIFVAFDCEEWGLYGSQHMAADYAGATIDAMVQLDMITWNMPSKLNQSLFFGNSASLKSALGSAFDLYAGITWSDGGDWAASDHWYFEQSGFAGVWPFEAQKLGNTSIHNSADNIDVPGYIDFDYGIGFVRGTVGYLATAAGVSGLHGEAMAPEPGALLGLAMGLCCFAGIARKRTADRKRKN